MYCIIESIQNIVPIDSYIIKPFNKYVKTKVAWLWSPFHALWYRSSNRGALSLELLHYVIGNDRLGHSLQISSQIFSPIFNQLSWRATHSWGLFLNVISVFFVHSFALNDKRLENSFLSLFVLRILIWFIKTSFFMFFNDILCEPILGF